MSKFCPLINGPCQFDCIFIEQRPHITGFGFVNTCALANATKEASNRPNAELLIELKKLISKF